MIMVVGSAGGDNNCSWNAGCDGHGKVVVAYMVFLIFSQNSGVVCLTFFVFFYII